MNGLSPERAAKRAQERADLDLIGQIASRAVAKPEFTMSRTDLVIKLIQINNVNKLDLEKLLNLPRGDFLADLAGLIGSTGPGSGVLLNGFEPRCGRRS